MKKILSGIILLGGLAVAKDMCFATSKVDGGVSIIAYSKECPIDVVIPESINGEAVVAIADNAFDSYLSDRPKLRSVVIANSVKTIGSRAFSGNKITKLSLGEGLVSIDFDAFKTNEIQSVVLPKSLKTIAHHAFSGNKLTTLVIPDNVIDAGYDTFNFNEIKDVKIGSGIKTLGSGLFYNNKLTKVEIPNNITRIDYGAFAKNNLSEVKIGSNVEIIEGFAFLNNNLKSVVIPKSVKFMGDFAFDKNPIESIKLESKIPPKSGVDLGINGEILVPKDSLGAYKADVNFGVKKLKKY